MTAFVLVPGAHTGGWVWHRVAARLRAAGAGAHPVTLTGMRDTGMRDTGMRDTGQHAAPDAAPDARTVGLDTHVDDVVRTVDQVPAGTDVVLVGHCYGIHPVLGAAVRRTGRVARIVYLDSPPAQDCVPAAALVPDPQARAALAAAADAPDTDGALAPPDRAAWHRWGSLDGVPEDDLDRLVDLAAPQPYDTLAQPLRITPEVAALPSTGVLCTRNGSTVDIIESQLGLGDPRLLALAEPQVRFLELAAGHWPMLSAPDDLAGALLRAAAGEGVRLTPPSGPPAHLRPFLLDLPERARERVGRVDLYPPDTEGPRPAVVLVHGGPVPADATPTPRDWPTYTGYARLLAGRGVLAATVDHRLHDLVDQPRAADDVADAVALVRADPRVDADRVALWFFSGGGLLSAPWLARPPAWLRCVAATYPVLAPPPSWGVDGAFRPADAVRSAGQLPIVLTRVGLETPEFAASVAEFLAAATDCAARVEVVDLPEGRHGFETIDHGEAARNAVRDAADRVVGHLLA